MGVHRFAVSLAIATFALTVFGGLVSTTGSGLACPDWPLCEGQWIPQMVNGKEFEHTHRLVASFVGAMTFGLMALLFKHRRRERFLVGAGIVASVLVVIQALLGALTVKMKLPWYVSSTHLAVASTFFALTVSLAFWTRPEDKPLPRGETDGAYLRYIYPLVGLVFAQLVAGGVMRHLKAGLACGFEVLTCQGALWPVSETYFGTHIHMVHRTLGMLAGIGVIALAVGLLRAPGVSAVSKRLAGTLGVGVVLQIVLGFASVLSSRDIAVMTVHSSLGIALFGGLVSLVWLARPAHRVAGAPGVAVRDGLPKLETAS
ncbi:MAG: COX15/CtaA family protein [Myxococcaceae bacterium]|nr:COX15/CtaA family protein [Myxococcaceae bacterium]